MSGRGCCCCCSNDSMADRRRRSISLWLSASLASSLLSSYDPLRNGSRGRRDYREDPWFFRFGFDFAVVRFIGVVTVYIL